MRSSGGAASARARSESGEPEALSSMPCRSSFARGFHRNGTRLFGTLTHYMHTHTVDGEP